MIPVFPFDGGNILRSLVLIIWRRASPHQAYLICLVIAQMTAISLFFAAWILRENNPNELIPTWFVLVMLGIIVFFSSKRQATLDGQHLEQVELARGAHAPSFLVPEADADYIDLEDSLDDDATISDWLHQHTLLKRLLRGCYSGRKSIESYVAFRGTSLIATMIHAICVRPAHDSSGSDLCRDNWRQGTFGSALHIEPRTRRYIADSHNLSCFLTSPTRHPECTRASRWRVSKSAQVVNRHNFSYRS